MNKNGTAGMEQDLDSLFAKLDMDDKRRDGDDKPMFRDPDDDFDEEPFSHILDALSLMDRDRYLELLKKRHKIQKMRKELVLADLDDDGTDLKHSKDIAGHINENHKSIVGNQALGEERTKLEDA